MENFTLELKKQQLLRCGFLVGLCFFFAKPSYADIRKASSLHVSKGSLDFARNEPDLIVWIRNTHHSTISQVSSSMSTTHLCGRLRLCLFKEALFSEYFQGKSWMVKSEVGCACLKQKCAVWKNADTEEFYVILRKMRCFLQGWRCTVPN